MNRMIGVAVVVLAIAMPGAAQDKASVPTPEAAKVAAAPVLPEDVKRAITDLALQEAGYARAIAVLQEKRDAINAQIGRVVEDVRKQFPGYELTQALTLVKNPEPLKAPEKKDPPK